MSNRLKAKATPKANASRFRRHIQTPKGIPLSRNSNVRPSKPPPAKAGHAINEYKFEMNLRPTAAIQSVPELGTCCNAKASVYNASNLPCARIFAFHSDGRPAPAGDKIIAASTMHISNPHRMAFRLRASVALKKSITDMTAPKAAPVSRKSIGSASATDLPTSGISPEP